MAVLSNLTVKQALCTGILATKTLYLLYRISSGHPARLQSNFWRRFAMTRPKQMLSLGLLTVIFALTAQPGRAADQTVPGAGNAAAIALANKSPIVQSAKQFLLEQINNINNGTIRGATLDAVGNPLTCVTHRAGLTATGKETILGQLIAAGLVDTADGSTFPGGLMAGVFPRFSTTAARAPSCLRRFSRRREAFSAVTILGPAAWRFTRALTM